MAHPSIPASRHCRARRLDQRTQATPDASARAPVRGVIPHLATEMLLRRLDANDELVHYRGNPDGLARPRGRARAGDGGCLPDLRCPLVRDGRARAVAVHQRSAVARWRRTSSRLSPKSLPGFETASWLAVAAPAGLPEAISPRGLGRGCDGRSLDDPDTGGSDSLPWEPRRSARRVGKTWRRASRPKTSAGASWSAPQVSRRTDGLVAVPGWLAERPGVAPGCPWARPWRFAFEGERSTAGARGFRARHGARADGGRPHLAGTKLTLPIRAMRKAVDQPIKMAGLLGPCAASSRRDGHRVSKRGEAWRKPCLVAFWDAGCRGSMAEGKGFEPTIGI